jgi:choline dehydrogenase-like flavoprotein
LARPPFDVCIVGSGPGGGIAAYALAQAGVKVALVEAGRRLRPGLDFNAHGSVYDSLEARLKAGRPAPVSSVFNDYAERNHFVPVGDGPKHGFLKALGGRSLCWAGHSLRFGPLDFEKWPIRYEEVAPYYSRAEQFMAVYGDKDGLSNMPDGEYLKPVRLRCGEEMLRRGTERLKRGGRKVEFIRLRKAMPTERHPLRTLPCHYCGHCMRGCEVDAKYTSANTPIPLALKTGNLSLFLESTMVRILMDQSGRRVRGIEYRKPDGGTDVVECRALILACSAIETARHLLLNRTREFPDGLANGSGQVGRNLSSHFGVTVVGLFPQIRKRDASNDDGTDYFHGLVTGLYWDQPSRDFAGTYQIQCGSGVHPLDLSLRDVRGFGSSFKRELLEFNTTHASLGMQGALLTSAGTFVDLDPEKKDSNGLAQPRVHLHYTDNDLAMARDMVALSEEIIHAAGGTIYRKPHALTPQTMVIDSNHWVGTVRMGHDAKTSVVNSECQSHEVPNLWIGDASVFAYYPEKNPTLTNIALSWRMSDRLAEKLRRDDL